MRKLKVTMVAITIGFLLVSSLDYVAYATTGKSLLLGKANTADKVTTVKRTTGGPAMSFKVKNGTGAPIKVNSGSRIRKLNADKVDGRHASDLGVRTTIFDYNVSLTDASQMQFTLSGVPAGTYLATMDGWIYGPTGASMICYLRPTASLDRLQQWFPADTGNTYFPVSTSGVITVTANTDPYVRCSAGSPGNWTDYNNFQVSLTKVDSVTSGTIAVARRSPGDTAAR